MVNQASYNVSLVLSSVLCSTPTPPFKQCTEYLERLSPDLKKFYNERIKVSPEKAKCILEYIQGTKEWLDSRWGRMTGSINGTVTFHNPYTHPDNLVEKLLKPIEKNAAMKRGNEKEPIARQQYIDHMKEKIAEAVSKKQFYQEDVTYISEDGSTRQGISYYVLIYQAKIYIKKAEWSNVRFPSIRVEELGLLIDSEDNHIGASPDGLIYINDELIGLLEIKCPSSGGFALYPLIKLEYFDQIQTLMKVYKLRWSHFFVWNEKSFSIQYFEFDAIYCKEWFFPRIHDWYFKRYLPVLYKEHQEKERMKREGPDIAKLSTSQDSKLTLRTVEKKIDVGDIDEDLYHQSNITFRMVKSRSKDA